ncbi:MAG: hypothetical protein AAGH15_21540, partial [Myxococcota bacterium]
PEGCAGVFGIATDAVSCFAGPPVQTSTDSPTQLACASSGGDPFEATAYVWVPERERCFLVDERDARRFSWAPCAEALPSCDSVAPITDPAELCGPGLAGRLFEVPAAGLDVDTACEDCLCATVLGMRCEARFVPLVGFTSPGLDLGDDPPWPPAARESFIRGGGIAGEEPDGRLHWACWADACDLPPTCDPARPDRLERVRGRVVNRNLLGDARRFLLVSEWTERP